MMTASTLPLKYKDFGNAKKFKSELLVQVP